MQRPSKVVEQLDRYRCHACGSDVQPQSIHYADANWEICEICGLAARKFPDQFGIDVKQSLAAKPAFVSKRFKTKHLEYVTSQNPVVVDHKVGGSKEDSTQSKPVLVAEGFWLRSDAIERLRAMISSRKEGTQIYFVVPLSGIREVHANDLSGLIADGSFAYRFGWQTFYLLLHGLGLRDIWRFDAEGCSAGLHLVSATIIRPPDRLKLSVIMPVFNEKSTIEKTLRSVLQKLDTLSDLDSEIILVESNSTDGTKEIISILQETSKRLRIIWQEQPRGKGHAVREGLENSNGDIVLIQDADDEYSVDDYDHLVGALVDSRAPFVLGARDTSAWRMRAFENATVLSAVYNLGHVFFTGVLNVLLRTRLHDPFTMYKVFFRDCVHGLSFNCNRFDFDHELVIKLVRKGFVPTELPASYVSRTHAEGKKVSLFKDGMFWIFTDLRLRFEALSKPEYR
jgi:hypothetical protein